ncbi:MAG: 2-C-methyl-D-erythritol 4-phosphate cytidylyltransferase [Methanogenium sp.]|jgi:2-C-methyl-D-erythritol 4-phosphate cytidylyltransferase
MIDVIYLSGGSGVRADLGYPKQFARLKGKPILIYGLETLRKIEEIGKIIISANNFYKTEMILTDYYIKNYELVEKGETRQLSVYNALKKVETDYVLIMEAVRPFCSEKLIRKVLKFTGDFIVPRSYFYSTVIQDFGKIIDRDFCGEVQMPQKYQFKLLNECHEKAKKTNLLNFTDDSALVMNFSNIKPKVLKGEQCNIKITTPLDLVIAEGIYEYYNNRE